MIVPQSDNASNLATKLTTEEFKASNLRMQRKLVLQLLFTDEHGYFRGINGQSTARNDVALDWTSGTLASEFAAAFDENEQDIYALFCNPRCGLTCKGPRKCPYMRIEDAHELLGIYPGGQRDYRARHGIPPDAPRPFLPAPPAPVQPRA